MKVVLRTRTTGLLGTTPLRRQAGFTLVEMLVAVAILSVMVALIAVIGSETNQMWTQSSQRIEQFQGARNAFELMTRTITQATLNTYYTVNRDASGNPISFGRTSNLEFVSGSANATGLGAWGTTGTTTPAQITHAIFFAAPLGYTASTGTGSSSYVGLDNLLCACGFYIQYGQEPTAPIFLAGTNPSATAYRFRLMEVLPPTEQFPIYTSVTYTSPVPSNTWIAGMWPTASQSGWVHQIAANIVALVIRPEDPSSATPTSIAPTYDYDSAKTSNTLTYCQLPPVLHIAMVAIDEKSALQLGDPTAPIDFGQKSTLFTIAANFESDLAQLQSNLAQRHINSRLFETRIALRESKWTTQ